MIAVAQPLAAELAWQDLLARISERITARGDHPARVVVLLPYAQLMPLAARLWAQAHPDGFAPRFETTRNWARQLAPLSHGEDDFTFDAARDTLTARSLLERAGLGSEREALTAPLLDAARSLAGLAAAMPPDRRETWAAQARAALAAGPEEGGSVVWEAALARIAVAWTAATAYATDVLFEDRVADGLDSVIVLQGFQTEPLTQTLLAHWTAFWMSRRDGMREGAIDGERALVLALPVAAPQGTVALHAASDAEDEAQRAAACVLRHLEAGHAPVALVAGDRALTRRIHAMLATAQVTVRDETGWKLSTTRAAAAVMATLRACARNASGDAVLDWLKNAPAFGDGAVLPLERWLRKTGLREWREPGAMAAMAGHAQPELTALLARIGALRADMATGRKLAQWLASLRGLLQSTGQWEPLHSDAAGFKLLAVLRLQEGAQADLEALGSAGHRMSLVEFSAWVGEVLEAASFSPAAAQAGLVAIVPLAQMLARPFAALVLPGCDELRLPSSPEPPGAWTAAQRAALGLPSREALERAQRAAWACALQTPRCDLLWRGSDEGGEPLLPSPLVQALQMDALMEPVPDPRPQRKLTATPTLHPAPSGQALPVRRLSASAYSDLRTCPYRFFALRQLGLQTADELETEIDKRDFGLWLHAVLKHFHETLQNQPTPDAGARAALLDEAADAVTRAQSLEAGEFLPFAAAWPQVRDGYLSWLAEAEAQGAVFEQAEVWREHALGRLTLIGQIDRIDRVTGGQRLVIDYKTEGRDATVRRIQSGAEDTQLGFYAALLDDDTLRAAYVNVGEKEGTQTHEQPDVVALRDRLIDGILHDVSSIEAGAPLPALGEGAACEHCAARGLCRKDFW